MGVGLVRSLQPPDILLIHWRVHNSTANTSKGVLFLPPSDAYVRSFLCLLYTLIKLYYTKALSDQALDWIPLLRRPRILESFCGSATTFQLSAVMEVWGQGASMVKFWWECSPCLAHGHLLTISSHLFPWHVCIMRARESSSLPLLYKGTSPMGLGPHPITSFKFPPSRSYLGLGIGLGGLGTWAVDILGFNISIVEIHSPVYSREIL